MDIIITTILALSIILVFYVWYRQDDPRLPPCPVTPLPIVGHMLYLGKNPRPQLEKWRKKCGDIFILYMGQTRVVVLNGYDLLQKVFVKQGGLTSERPPVFYDEATGKPGKGIGFSSGSNWKEQREVTLSILRSLGMGKNILADRIQEIAEDLIDVLRSLKGKPIVLAPITSITVSNVICSLVVGYRFKHDDESFLQVVGNIRSNLSDAGPTNMVNFFPILSHIPGDLFAAKRIRSRAEYIMGEFVERFIRKIESGETSEHHPDNFIGAYLNERNKRHTEGKTTFLDHDNLRRIVYDLLGAGMETTTSTIDWCILYLLHYPEVQEKLFKEIEEEVGTERLPNMNDKFKLPYLNAVIQETLRLASIVPFSIPHTNNKEITVGGYVIPKGTELLPNLDSVLWEKNIWGEDADLFRPERFLDECGRVKSPEEFIPFSIGNRVCAGEGLAKMELFLILGAMIQRFKFLPEDPKALPPLDTDFGFTACPVPYKVRVVERIF